MYNQLHLYYYHRKIAYSIYLYSNLIVSNKSYVSMIDIDSWAVEGSPRSQLHRQTFSVRLSISCVRLSFSLLAAAEVLRILQT